MSERVVVFGGASLDTLHFRGQTVRSAGGAGLYTALAAHRAGAQVTMVGPVPDPMPAELASVAERLDWRGPSVPPARLPSFEIAHLGGGKTEMRSAQSRAEADLGIDWVPADVSADWVYCIPLVDPHRQLEVLRYFADRGRKTACGTYSTVVAEEPETVRQALTVADVFFCNESEAVGLFGELDAARTEPGRLLFVTRSARGVRVIQGDYVTEVPGVTVEELDPTGAGDTFCGTVLARLAAGEHPIVAARQGVAAAAEMVTAVGPAALLRKRTPGSSHPALDGGVVVDDEQVARVAAELAKLDEVTPFNFTGRDFPAPDHPYALDFFFAATVQQFGFWSVVDGRFDAPAVLRLEDRDLKGSDYLWAAYHRWLNDDPAGLTPRGQRDLDVETFVQRLESSDGHRLPAHALHLQQAQAYGRDLTALGWQPAEMAALANADPRPLRRFLSLLDHVGGFKEDPLRKKSVLLALILRQRPEGFLAFSDSEPVPPVVDYHIQRSCLRIGLVRVTDPDLRRRVTDRQILPSSDEERIRQTCYRAMEQLQSASGRSMGAVDWFFFQNRRRCPEMTEPVCGQCPLDSVCAHDKALFQPVVRTTFY